MKRFDFAALNQIDLARLIEQDLGPARSKSGHRLYWLCPTHDDHHPSFDLNTRQNKAFCNVCGTSWTPISWLTKFRKMSLRDACEELERMSGVANYTVKVAPKVDKPYLPPAADVTVQFLDIVEHGRRELWRESGDAARVRSWLNRRGLNDGTLRQWHVGYNPASQFIGKAWVWAGVLIPTYMDGTLWGIKIRLLPVHPISCMACRAPMSGAGVCQKCGKRNKYRTVKGSEPALFGANTCQGRRVAFGCEGEFDAMLVWQEARQLGGAFTTTNGAGKDWRPDWSLYLMDAERIILLFDNDEAGAKGKAKLAGLGDRVRPVAVPTGKDVTDFHLMPDRNLYAWLHAERYKALAGGYRDAGHELAVARERLQSALPPALAADYQHDIGQLTRIVALAEETISAEMQKGLP